MSDIVIITRFPTDFNVLGEIFNGEFLKLSINSALPLLLWKGRSLYKFLQSGNYAYASALPFQALFGMNLRKSLVQYLFIIKLIFMHNIF